MVDLFLEFVFELVGFVTDENFVQILVFSETVDDRREGVFLVLKVLSQLIHVIFKLHKPFFVILLFFNPELLFNEKKCVFI